MKYPYLYLLQILVPLLQNKYDILIDYSRKNIEIMVTIETSIYYFGRPEDLNLGKILSILNH